MTSVWVTSTASPRTAAAHTDVINSIFLLGMWTIYYSKIYAETGLEVFHPQSIAQWHIDVNIQSQFHIFSIHSRTILCML